MVPKSVTLNDLERRIGVILHYFSEFGYLNGGALRKSSRSLSHLLMSSCIKLNRKTTSKISIGDLPWTDPNGKAIYAERDSVIKLQL